MSSVAMGACSLVRSWFAWHGPRLSAAAFASFVLSVLMTSQPVLATDSTWQVSSGDWFAASSWNGGVPTLSSDAYISGGTASITQSGEVCYNLSLASSSTASNGTVQMTGGGLATGNEEYIGFAGTANFIHSGGTHVVASMLILGNNLGSSGTYTLSSSGQLSSSYEYVGYAGVGTFIQSGGTNVVSTTLGLGVNAASGSGTYNLNSTGQLSSQTELVGATGAGSFTQSGGNNAVAANLYVGGYSNGTYTLSGSGQLSSPTQYIGYSGSGNFTQSGGTNTASSLYIGFNLGVSGTDQFNGGTLIANQVSGGAGAGVFNFNGGLLQAAPGANSTFMSGLTNVYVQSGGARIDTNGQNIIISQSLLDGGGGLTKFGYGTLILTGSNTYTGGTTVNQGTLQANTVSLQGNVCDNAAVVFNQEFPGLYSGSISGSGSLTKMGADRLALTGSNTYTGSTNISSGTMEVDSPLPGPAGQVSIQSLATLVAYASIERPIAGVASNSQIIANTANVSLGDSTSYTGFNHAGTLTIGSNIVTLNSASFANLGVLTTLGSGTLSAPNGVTIPLGGNLVGSGTVNGKVAAGYGSTINATGNLTLGDSTSPAGFSSAGELYTGANTVTLQSKNQAVLGSLTQIGDNNGNSGTLIAANGIVLDYGNNLVGQGTVSTPNTLAGASIINGNVDGTGSGLNFTGYIKGAGSFTGSVTFSGSYSLGNSPALILMDNATFSPSSSLIMEIAGPTAGSQFDQLEISNQAMLGGTLVVILANGYSPSAGQVFDLFNGPTMGSFAQYELPALSNGLSWNTSNVATNGTISVTPEPSSLALLAAAGAIGFIGYGLRRRKATSTAKPTAFAQQDVAAILSYHSHSSPVNAARRAA